MSLKRVWKRFLILLLLCVTFTFWLFKCLDFLSIDKVEPTSTWRHLPQYSLKNWGGRSRWLPKLVTGVPPGRFSHSVNLTQGHSRQKHPWMFPRPLTELGENKVVPNHVFFMWCQNRTFTFNDYLSVLGAWKLLEPDSLEIHRDTDVATDKYNQWFGELRLTIPALTVKFVERKKSICSDSMQYMLEVLSDRGGVFLDFSTILLRSVHVLRKRNFSISFDETGRVAFIVSTIHSENVKRVLQRPAMGMTAVISQLKQSVQSSGLCPPVSKTLPLALRRTVEEKITCVTLSSELILKPLDLREMEGETLSMLMDLYYVDLESDGGGTVDTILTDEESIPFIVHYVWFGASEFSFRMYLSFLSTIHVAQADRVFIHSDLFLSGHYWRTVQSHPKVTVVYREPPHEIYGHPVLYTQHRSDVVRADLLDKYGGIYMDWDVLWLRSPRPLLHAGHGTVMDLDHMPRPPFPEVLNLGVLLARPRARFVRLWRQGLRQYRSEDFFYNALELPFKVYERHPDTAFVEKRLQVMCFWLRCHPIFHPEYKDWLKAQPFDWRKDAFSIHFTHPDPVEYDSIVDLINATGTFRDIGMFILEKSGELDMK